MGEIIIVNTRPEHFAALEALQQLCYPTLHDSHLLKVPHFESHVRLFPEGQHVALRDGEPVGMSATFRIQMDFGHTHHAFNDIIAEGFFTNHDPEGEWLYGADMSVHPELRRLGVASRMYQARKSLVKALGLKGMVIGGMMPGYRHHRDSLNVVDYVDKVARGELADPTLTPQLRQGFEVRGILYDYLHDELLGNEAALLVWENPER